MSHLAVDTLFDCFPTAVIVGLPGAGKTTIMRHCAWKWFEKNPDSPILLIEAKHISDDHILHKESSDTRDIFQVLTTLFLCPGINPNELSNKQKYQIEETIIALNKCWEERRLIVLIDALDEAPTLELRRWLAAAANHLMKELMGPFDPKTKSPDLPQGRCYLSLRAVEMEGQGGLAFTHAPIFVVNSLTTEQIRDIARTRLDTSAYAKFDDQIWRRLDIQKIAGTPLTAMLMVFFYQVYGRFDRRFATYKLMVLFFLYRAWEQIKAGQFYQPGQGLSPFFQEVHQSDFLDSQSGVKMQYYALADIARQFLYHRRSKEGNTERTIHCKELWMLLDDWMKKHPFEGKRQNPNDWINVWRKENLLLPIGHDLFAFPHATMLEFLAAVDLGQLLEEPDGHADEINHVFNNRTGDTLETLPFLCSEDHQTAWKGLGRLGLVAESFVPESTLPFRCLAETEIAERDYIEQFGIERLYTKAKQEVDAHTEKEWAYKHLCRWVNGIPNQTDTEQLKWLDERYTALEGAIPLCRTRLKQYLHNWKNDQTPVAKKQEALLQRMLTKEAWEEAFPALPQTIAPDEETNLAYYRKTFTPAIVHFYGSPNFHHGGAVRALAFSPDGRFVVSASEDGLLILWDRLTGRERLRFVGHSAGVYACAFSRDGETLASGSWDNTLILWEAKTGKAIRTLTGHSASVVACAFSPNGETLVSGSEDQTLILWKVSTGEAIRTLTGHRREVNACAFSRDGETLASGSWDNTLILWEAKTGKAIRTLTGHSASVVACAFSRDGETLASGSSDQTLILWEVKSGRQIGSWSLGWPIYGVAFHPTMEGHIVVALQNGTLALLDLKRGAGIPA